MKIYLRLVFALAFFAGLYGVILPMMISSTDDILVISGFAGFFVGLPILFYILKPIILILMEKTK